MAKRTAPAPSASEIPITYGRQGRAAERRDHVSIIGTGKTLRLIVYPSDAPLEHMSNWHYASGAFQLNGSGEIDGLKLTKAERGFNLRKVHHRRPHLHISLADVVVHEVDGSDGDDVGTVIATIEGDAVVFTLPLVIAGSGKRRFKITTRS
jgi:hypothetical protein